MFWLCLFGERSHQSLVHTKALLCLFGHVRLNLTSQQLILLCLRSLSNPCAAVIILLCTEIKRSRSPCPWVSHSSSRYKLSVCSPEALCRACSVLLHFLMIINACIYNWMNYNTYQYARTVALQWSREIISLPHMISMIKYTWVGLYLSNSDSSVLNAN